MANNKKNNGKGGGPQLNFLPVLLPAENPNGKNTLDQLIKKVDLELYPPDQDANGKNMPPHSANIKNAIQELNAYQMYIMYTKISERDLEKLKDVADNNITATADQKLKALKAIWALEENPPVEIIGRVFATIDFILKPFHNPNNQNIVTGLKWLEQLKNDLKKSKPVEKKMLIALAMKLVRLNPAQAIVYVKSLEYYYTNDNLKEVLK